MAKERIRFCDEDCNHCELILSKNSRQLTKILNLFYDKFGDEAYGIIQRECPNLTCCADCHIDDFCHLERDELVVEERKKQMAKEQTTETEEPKKMNRFFRLWLISMISAGVAAVFKGALISSISFGLLSGLLGWFAGIIFVGGWIAAIIGLIVAFLELVEEKGWTFD